MMEEEASTMSRIGTIAANLIRLNMALSSSAERVVKEHGKLTDDHGLLADEAAGHARAPGSDTSRAVARMPARLATK